MWDLFLEGAAGDILTFQQLSMGWRPYEVIVPSLYELYLANSAFVISLRNFQIKFGKPKVQALKILL